ncbi:putative HET domain-containing protein [Rosellinia necatrix]|uniref:Putative HET domain-containing protein n=1 Tax=Rosellinia necatrix TaxID=77044 RepID=A0A1S7UID7_ROSNE|nr:putative HET domain-containing protein [Rosellinia necatrix]
MAERKIVKLPLIPYQYQPLSPAAQTRIIVLEPSLDASAPLVCGVEELQLVSDEGFQALSYTWGEPRLTETLVVNRVSLLRITANLRDALRRFRLPFGPRRLWVDAICINQGDEGEKARQIPFMDVIYRSASAVLVWLGDYPTQAACLAYIRDYPRLLGQERGPHSRLGRQEHSELSMSISSLVELPWFSRRWIVQEAVLNADVLLCCCDRELSWVRLAACLGMIKNPAPRFKPFHTLLAMASLWKRWVLDTDVVRDGGIFDLLEAFDHFQCANDKDRLFALGGLATDLSLGPNPSPGSLPLHVDYTITTEALYTNFARDVLESGSVPMKHQMLISSINRCSDGQTSLPSWVPDWRVSAIRTPFFHYEVYNSLVRFEYNPPSLLLHGQEVRGPEVKVSGTYEALPARALSLSEINNWLRTMGKLWLDRYPNPGLSAYAKFITECAHSSGLQISGDAVFSMISWVMSADQLNASGLNEHVYTLTDIGGLMQGRRVFCWSDPTEPSPPHIGIGPDHIQIGDEMIAAKRPSSGDHSFQVVLIARYVAAASAKLIGDAVLVLSLDSANFWFPSPKRSIPLD